MPDWTTFNGYANIVRHPCLRVEPRRDRALLRGRGRSDARHELPRGSARSSTAPGVNGDMTTVPAGGADRRRAPPAARGLRRENRPARLYPFVSHAFRPRRPGTGRGARGRQPPKGTDARHPCRRHALAPERASERSLEHASTRGSSAEAPGSPLSSSDAEPLDRASRSSIPNTVQVHPAILAERRTPSLRQSAPARGSPRPRRVHGARPSAAGPGGRCGLPPTADAHRRARGRALVDVVAGQADAGEAAERAGRAWGREEARPGRADRRPDRTRWSQCSTPHGFAPVAEGREVAMRRCPFPDLARTSPEVVCGVHRGLVDRACSKASAPGLLGSRSSRSFPDPNVCIGPSRRARSHLAWRAHRRREVKRLAGSKGTSSTAMVHRRLLARRIAGSSARPGGARDCGRRGPGKWGALRLTTRGRRSERAAERDRRLLRDDVVPPSSRMAMNGWGAAEPAWWLQPASRSPDAVVELAGGARRECAEGSGGGGSESGCGSGGARSDENLDAYAARRPRETAVVVLEPRAVSDEAELCSGRALEPDTGGVPSRPRLGSTACAWLDMHPGGCRGVTRSPGTGDDGAPRHAERTTTLTELRAEAWATTGSSRGDHLRVRRRLA